MTPPEDFHFPPGHFPDDHFPEDHFPEPTTIPGSTLPPTTVPWSTLPPTTVVPTTMPPTTVGPTTLPPTSLPPTTAGPTTVAPTTVAGPTTIVPTSLPPTSMPPTSAPPTTLPYTTIYYEGLPMEIPPVANAPSVPLSYGGKMCLVNELSTCYWVLRFYDENGDLDTPSHIWTKIDCLSSGLPIQVWTLEPTRSSIWTKMVTPKQNKIVGTGSDNERRILTVKARFNSDEDMEVNEEFEWLVRNLKKVT